MFEMKVRFTEAEEIKSFCALCQKMTSDIDLVSLENPYDRIDGKSIIGLMTLELNVPLLVQIHGEDETCAGEKFSEFALDSAK